MGSVCAVFVLLAAMGVGDAWTRVETPTQRLYVDEVPEHGLGSLRIEEGRLIRRRRGVDSAIPCVAGQQVGELRSLALDPAGGAFVAAEGGLFVITPQVDVLDLIELQEGAPQGSPSSVLLDESRRVWYATDRAFGCIDPSFYHGNAIPLPDAAGAGPFELVESEGEGVVVASALGAWRYVPDQGAPPEILSVQYDGRELERDERIDIAYPSDLPLSATGTGNGPLRYRYRVDRHHVWTWLEDAVDQGLEPGTHTLEVVAEDRDLRLSDPFPLRIDVAYPYYYRTGFVIGCVGLGALLLFAFFRWIGEAPAQGSRTWRAALSTVLSIVLLLQILAGLIPHARGWPFIGYSMYTESLEVGHLAYNGVLIGITETGNTHVIPVGAFSAGVDNRWQVLGPIARGGPEKSAAAIAKFNSEAVGRAPLVRMQVWAKRTRLTEEGPVPVAQLILSDYDARTASEEGQ